MTKKEAKNYILREWKKCSGKKISMMLERYWKMKEEKINEAVDAYKTAQKIFNA